MQANAQLLEKKATINTRNHKIPPSPRGNLLSAILFGLPQDIVGFYMNAARQYGDIVRFQTGPWFFWYFVSHPDYIKHVLQDNNQNYCKKSKFNDVLKLMVGEGLLTSDGELWRRQRRLVQPAFHHQRIAALATLMTDTTTSMLERWRTYTGSDQSLDIALEMRRLALGIAGKAFFDIDISNEANEVGRAMTMAGEHFNHRSRHLVAFPESIPTPRNRRFHKAIRTLNKVIYGIIEERRPEGKDTGDLLSMLLLTRDEETGEGMSDKQLRDEVMTFALAGHETTANTLAWTWYLLSLHPDVERKLHAELAKVLGGRPPTFQDLANLKYTRMVIEESLRLYPPAWGFTRTAIKDDEIGGYHIPANSIVILSPYVTHRHPVFWENPEGFDPERFTPERSAGRPRYAYFPFGGGPRQCIGNDFAMIEAQLIVAMVAQKYRLHLVPGHPVEPVPFVQLRPRCGVLVTLHKA